MASGIYTRGIKAIFEGSIDIWHDLLHVMLIDGSGYTFDPDQQYISSGAGTIGSNEIPTVASYAGGYGGGGRKLLTNQTIILNDANNTIGIDGPDLTWTALNDGVVGGAALVFQTGGSDATSRLICYIDNATQFPITTNGGDITIQWSAFGIFLINC
jgi:hypothetical protein